MKIGGEEWKKKGGRNEKKPGEERKEKRKKKRHLIFVSGTHLSESKMCSLEKEKKHQTHKSKQKTQNKH